MGVPKPQKDPRVLHMPKQPRNNLPLETPCLGTGSKELNRKPGGAAALAALSMLAASRVPLTSLLKCRNFANLLKKKKKIKKAQLGEAAKVPRNEMYLTEQEVWRSQALKCPKCLVVLQTSAGHFPEAGLQESSA